VKLPVTGDDVPTRLTDVAVLAPAADVPM